MLSDVLNESPFSKTQFMVRIEMLEEEIRLDRKIAAEKDKQIADLSEAFQALAGKFKQMAQVTDGEGESFWKSLLTYLPFREGEILKAKPYEDYAAAVKQSLREFKARIVK